jgi:hypothetical protein
MSLRTLAGASERYDFDTQISIYEGASCEQLSCIAGNDNDCGLQSSVSWFAAAGELYYILVHGYTAGTFGLTVSEIENDSCPSSQPLPLDGSSAQWLISDSASMSFFDPCTASTVSRPSSWYSVTGTGGEMIVDTCDSANNVSQVSVLTSDCNSLGCLGFFRNDCAVKFSSTFGEEYQIFVADDAGSEFQVAIETSNDACESAYGPIFIGGVVRGSNAQATSDDVDGCREVPASNRGAGVWYSFVGTGREVTAFTCSEFTNFDTQISVYAGSDCGNLRCLGGKDDNCGTKSWMLFPAAEGQIFYILVSGKGASTGNFVMQLL